MSIDAMKQALAALETNLLVIEDYGDHEQLNRQHKAITALRAAIEQAQQKSLTEKRIEELYSFWVVDCQDIVGFARAIERTVKGEV